MSKNSTNLVGSPILSKLERLPKRERSESERTEFHRFADLASKLVRVPKKELDERRAADKD